MDRFISKIGFIKFIKNISYFTGMDTNKWSKVVVAWVIQVISEMQNGGFSWFVQLCTPIQNVFVPLELS